MSTRSPCRVMIVDSSAVFRGLLTKALETAGVQVTSSVFSIESARKEIGRVDVDVIILDIEPLGGDGLDALREILQKQPHAHIIVLSRNNHQMADISVAALELGAVEFVAKPEKREDRQAALRFRQEICDKVQSLAFYGRKQQRSLPLHQKRDVPSSDNGYDLDTRKFSLPPRAIAFASSTGGPQALMLILKEIAPAIRRAPIFITQHMPSRFTAHFAEHLSRASGMPCKEATNDEQVTKGHIYLAPGGWHMTAHLMKTDVVLRLNQGPHENFCRPSADPMLRSLSRIYREGLLIVVLTGMGSDGAKGALEAYRAGAQVIAQDEASSVVWGMPKAAAQQGICSAVLRLSDIGAWINERFSIKQ